MAGNFLKILSGVPTAISAAGTAVLEAIAAITSGDGYLERTSGGVWQLSTPSGSPSYTRLSAPVKEFDNVVISGTGQNYTFSSIPSTGDCLVHCRLFANSGLSYAVVFAHPDEVTKPVPSTNANGYPCHVGSLDAGAYFFKVYGEIWLAAHDGQIWARRGGSSAGITLDVIGYQVI